MGSYIVARWEWRSALSLIGIKILKALLLIMVAKAASASPMEFKIFVGTPTCPDCILVKADGEITNESPKLLADLIAENSAVFEKDATVVFNSLGGALMGGLEIGKILRSKGLNTHIARIDEIGGGEFVLAAGSCASSCAYAYLGGQRRSIDQQSKYGLHQISTLSETEVPLNQAVRSTQAIIADISEYVERMDASQELGTIAIRTSDSGVHWVNDGDLLALRIVNSGGLTQQRPWEQSANSNTWSIWSILPNGSKDRFILRCNESPIGSDIAGHVRVGFIQSKSLPKDHSGQNNLLAIPTEVYLNGDRIYDKREQLYWFDPLGHSAMGFQLSVKDLKQAVQTEGFLFVKVSYPDHFPENFSISDHPIPLDGLGPAIESLARVCPHFNN